MKKFMLALALSLCLLATPAMAGTIVIDEDLYSNIYNVETINKDGRIYVPIRFVSEKLGYTVDWQNEQVIIKYIPHPPEIKGSDSFKAQIQAALDLLAEKDPLDYRMICDNVNWIEAGEVSPGMEGYNSVAETSGNCAITISDKYLSDPSCTTINLAGALVHEATHDAFYMMSVFDHKEQEKQAYNKEIAALKILGADPNYIKQTEQTLDKILKQ